ncbi:MAG TPA: GNAT family N-acetyltransferase [Propionibacteriaceae bacterium]
MRFFRVDPDDEVGVAHAVALLNDARRQDDPDGLQLYPEVLSHQLRFGWDLEPEELYLCTPDGSATPVAVLELSLPLRDNLHLVWGDITVHPSCRRQGHGSTVMAELISRAQEAGRSTIWLGVPDDEDGPRAFLERFGFRFGSRDARRRQVLADVDAAAVADQYARAQQRAADYVVERCTLPTPPEVLEQLVEVTAAINDAPMGDLSFEDEHFDVRRLQDFEAAAAGRQDRVYRIWARHRTTGEIGGHTVVTTNDYYPTFGWQADTAVSRGHRGHRLGLLLKVQMMHLLAEQEPQIQVVETWNNADNSFMIDVNEAIGYRLSRVFATYQLDVPTHDVRSAPQSSA